MRHALAPVLLLLMASPALASGGGYDCDREASRAEVRAARAHGRLGPCALEAYAEQQRLLTNRAVLWQYQGRLAATPAPQPAAIGPFNPQALDKVRAHP